jgi:cytochrome c biogenesis protein CcdA
VLDSLFDVPVAFAFGAGMVAAFNPCGAAMLPAYVGYQLSGDAETSNPLSAVLRGFYMGGVVTAGFVLLSLAVGLIVTVGGDAIFNIVPFAGLTVGIGIALLGLWLLISRRHLGIWVATRLDAGNERSTRGVFLFGMVYAVSS